MYKLLLYSFQLLEAHIDMSPMEIKKQYRRMVRRYHPDLNKSPDAVIHFRNIQRAMKIIEDFQKNPFAYKPVKTESTQKSNTRSSTREQSKQKQSSSQEKQEEIYRKAKEQERYQVLERAYYRKNQYVILAIFLSLFTISGLFSFFFIIARIIGIMSAVIALYVFLITMDDFDITEFIWHVRQKFLENIKEVTIFILGLAMSIYVIFGIISSTNFSFYLIILFALLELLILVNFGQYPKYQKWVSRSWFLVMFIFILNSLISREIKSEVVVNPEYGLESKISIQEYKSYKHELGPHAFDKVIKLRYLLKRERGYPLIKVNYRKSPLGMHIFESYEYIQ